MLRGLILYVQVNIFLITSGRVILGCKGTEQGLMYYAQGYIALTPMRLEPAALRSQVKHSTTEPLRSLLSALVKMDFTFDC